MFGKEKMSSNCLLSPPLAILRIGRMRLKVKRSMALKAGPPMVYSDAARVQWRWGFPEEATCGFTHFIGQPYFVRKINLLDFSLNVKGYISYPACSVFRHQAEKSEAQGTKADIAHCPCEAHEENSRLVWNFLIFKLKFLQLPELKWNSRILWQEASFLKKSFKDLLANKSRRRPTKPKDTEPMNNNANEVLKDDTVVFFVLFLFYP